MDKSYYAALSHSPAIIKRCLQDVAKAAFLGRGSDEAQANLRDVLRKTMALADILGRKRVLTESAARRGPTQFSARTTHEGFMAIVDTDCAARFGIRDMLKKGWAAFGDAIDALLAREPILARSREAISKAYALGTKFAVAKIPDSVADKSAKIITQKVWEKVAELGAQGRSPDVARKVLSEISGFSESYSETVYRTNLASAYTAGRFKQMEDPDIRAITPAFEFFAVNDASTRHNHGAADGAIADVGDAMWDRLSPPLGYNCFLPGTVIQGIADGALKARYSGDAVEFRTESGVALRVTANHPIATTLGFFPAHQICKGQSLLRYNGQVNGGSPHEVDEEHIPSRVEDVFCTLSKRGPLVVGRLMPNDLHGDAVSADPDIDVVGSYAVLWDALQARRQEYSGQSPLVFPDPSASLPGAPALAVKNRSVVRAALAESPFYTFGFGSSAQPHAKRREATSKSYPIDIGLCRELQHGLTSKIAPDKIVEIRYFNFSGHVYDLRNKYGWILADNIVASQCRCDLRIVDVFELRERGLMGRDGKAKKWLPATFRDAKPDKGFTVTRPDRRMYS